MAQKTKLTKTVTKDVSDRLLIGNFPKAAMESLGFNVRNYHYWRKRGEEEIERRELGEKPNRRESIYVDFFLETQRANSEAEHLSLVNIRDIATDKKGVDSRTRLEAEKFFMSSRFRERWGAHVKADIGGKIEFEVVIGTPAKLNVAKELPEDADDYDAGEDFDGEVDDDE